MKIVLPKALASLLVVLLISGCATPPAIMTDYIEKSTAIGLNIADTRAQEDKTTEHLSINILSCDYAVTRLGDEITVPNRLILLRRDLEAALGGQLSNSTVTVKRYRIHTNTALKDRNFASAVAMSAAPTNLGVLASGVAGAVVGATVETLQFVGSNCKKEEMRGGWFAGTELTAQRSPIIIEIEANWSATDYSVRFVYTPKQEILVYFSDKNSAAELFEAMHQAHLTLVAKMRKPLN